MISFRNIGNLGRFGNQMFQFAAAVGISRELGYDVIFPSENFIKNDNPNSYNGCKLMECFKIPESMLMKISDINPKYQYNEYEFTYNPHVKNLPPNTDISGYFQTPKYFDHIEQEIRKIFTFKKSIVDDADVVVRIENGISVHIRRGDYLTCP
jgi:hypothetical protein